MFVCTPDALNFLGGIEQLAFELIKNAMRLSLCAVLYMCLIDALQ